MNKIKISPKGFTLIELLVVVLIIGVLTAVALPGYRKAVEKSRVTDALNTMQAVAKSEHGWYLANGRYTKDFANLDIDLTDTNGNKADNASFANALYTYELLDTGIIADRNNGEYSLYKDYESSQILCTPGTHYICEDLGAFTKVPCEKVGMAWANSNSTCYASDEDRCKDLYNNNMWHPDQQNSANSYCGYVNSWKPTINEGMVCIATGRDGNCGYLTVNSGGKCIAKSTSGCNGNETGEEGVFTGGDCVADGYASCKAIKITNGTCYANAHSSCSSIVINSGASCVGKGEWSCKSITVNSGGKCVTEVDTTCEGIYNGTGCCEGKY